MARTCDFAGCTAPSTGHIHSTFEEACRSVTGCNVLRQGSYCAEHMRGATLFPDAGGKAEALRKTIDQRLAADRSERIRQGDGAGVVADIRLELLRKARAAGVN